MKILKFKGKMSLKNKLLILLGIVVLIAIVSSVLVYILNEEAREWININILKKEIEEEDIATIELDVDKTEYIYAYDKYITILCNGKLSIYNSYGSKEAELDVQISKPIYEKNNNYLVIAENMGQKIYLIENNKIVWEDKVEGQISKINVSKTGMVSAVTTGTSYKSVIVTFDREGHKLFNTFRRSSIAVDTDISVDGKYLAIVEVNTKTALIESSVEIIDIEKAVNGDAENSVAYIHNAESNKIIKDAKFQEKGQLICIYDDSIHMIYEGEDTILTEFNSNVQIADINLKSFTIRAEEISTGLFSAKTDIILRNIITGVETTYSVDSSVKEVISYDRMAAINLGTEIHFINLNGWLEKKYLSKQEAKEIVLGTSVAGIVYRDRIKVLSF